MAEQNTCLSPLCGITIEGTFKKCPQCGWVMRTSRRIRVMGGVTLVLALSIIAIVGSMGWVFLSAGSFTGTPGEADLAIAFFSFLILFGLVGVVNSVYNIVTGRTNRTLVKIIAVAVVILL